MLKSWMCVVSDMKLRDVPVVTPSSRDRHCGSHQVLVHLLSTPGSSYRVNPVLMEVLTT